MVTRVAIVMLLVILQSACSRASTPPSPTPTVQPAASATHTAVATSSPTASPAPTASVTPTIPTATSTQALTDDPLVLSVYCDLSDERARVPTTVPSNTEPDWNFYQNTAYDFSFSYPADWTMIEGPHALCLYTTKQTTQKSLLLIIGFKAEGEDLSIVARTGVGSGEIITQGTVRFLGKEMTRNVLVEDGKVRSVLYGYACEFPVGDRVFTVSLDDLREDWKEADIAQADQDLVDKIVESFAFTSR